MNKTKNLQLAFISLVVAGVLAFTFWNITQARIYNPTGAATADANTWTGLQTFTGFISSASSTVAGGLQIAGNLQASSTVTVTSLVSNSDTGTIGVSAVAPGAGAVYLSKTGGTAVTIAFDTSNADPTLDFQNITSGVNWTIGYDTSETNFVFAEGANPTTGNTKMVIANTTGRVGIGTTSPNSLLALDSSGATKFIIGSSGATTPTMDMWNSGRTWRFQVDSTLTGNPFAIYDVTAGGAGGYRFLIDSNGNIGVGTTTPSSILSVATRTANATTTLHLGKNTAGYGTCIQFYSADGAAYRQYFSNAATIVNEAGSCNGN